MRGQEIEANAARYGERHATEIDAVGEPGVFGRALARVRAMRKRRAAG